MSANIKKGRGKKWTDEEIRMLLSVAIDLDVNNLFDQHQMTASEVYNRIAGKFAEGGRDKHQIQLKFESLRRTYNGDKKAAGKSGAGAGARKTTTYDDLMDTLWGKRKKFTVPKHYGQETSAAKDPEDTNIDNLSVFGAESMFGAESISETASVDLDDANNSTTINQSPKRKRKIICDEFKTLVKSQQTEALNFFKDMQQKSDDRADRRAANLLTGIQETMSTLFAQKNQPIAHSTSQPQFQYNPCFPFKSFSSTQTLAQPNSRFNFIYDPLIDNLSRGQGVRPVITDSILAPISMMETPPSTPISPPDDESIGFFTSHTPNTNESTNESQQENELLIDFS